VEAIRTRLRLVCHGWNAILRDKGVKMVLDAFNDGSAHIFQAFDASRCVRSHSCKTPRVASSERDPTESAAEEFPNLRVFVGTHTGRYSIEKISSMAPRLQALQYRYVSVFLRVDTCPQRSWIESLTHLELRDIDQTATTPVEKQIILPRLSVLSLQFRLAKSTPRSEEKLWFHWWSLPAVKTLKIGGIFALPWVDGIEQFLTREWPNVTSFYLNLIQAETAPPYTFAPYVIRSTLWTSFPNLRTFGPLPAQLEANIPPPPPLHTPFSLVVDGIWDDFGLTNGYSLSRAPQIIDEWKIVTIIFLAEWKGMMDRLRVEKTRRTTTAAIRHDIPPPFPFFAAAMDRNIRLLDIERGPLSQEDGAELLELIQNWELDGSR
jgi:hypothetical protein